MIPVLIFSISRWLMTFSGMRYISYQTNIDILCPLFAASRSSRKWWLADVGLDGITIKIDLREIRCDGVGWIYQAQDRV
jgi:hypothetical protein